LALDLDVAEVLELERLGRQALRARGDEHRTGRRRRLHPSRDVHRIAEGRVLVAQVAANVPDDDRTRVDPRADPEVDAMRQPELAGGHLRAGAHSAARPTATP